MTSKPHITAVVPVKWKSRRLPGKNLALVNGREPAVMRTLRMLDHPAISRILVLADDETARLLDPKLSTPTAIVARDQEWLECSIDDLVDNYPGLPDDDWLLVAQPNVVTATVATFGEWLKHAVDKAQKTHCPVFAVTPSSHIAYVDGMRHPPDEVQIEVGWRLYPELQLRREPPTPLVVPGEVWDIDEAHELAAARSAILRRGTHVAFWCLDPEEGYGSGHLVRSHTLADMIARSGQVDDVTVHPGPTMPRPLGVSASVVVVDRLDTSRKMIDHLRNTGWGRIVTLEDLGPGALDADDTVNALYSDGPDWFVLRTEFLTVGIPERRNHAVVVSFGGVDVNSYTEQVVAELESKPVAIQVIDPPRRRSNVDRRYIISDDDRFTVAKAIAQAKVLITSRGRTAYEAGWLRTPTVCLAANDRELLHPTGGWTVPAVDPADAARQAVEIVEDPELWWTMSDAGRLEVDGFGAWRLTRRILGHVEEARWRNR